MRLFQFALLPAVVMAASFIPSSRVAAQAFEGVITVRMGGASRDGTPLPDLEYMARGGKMRLNVKSPMGTLAIIAVPTEKKLYTLLEAQAMYMEQPLTTDLGKGAATPNTPAPVITRTGKKETIAGYECEHVLIAAGQGSTDVCMARGLGPFLAAGATLGAAALPAWQRALADDGGFPLKVSRGDGTTQLEVTKIEKRTLPASLFAVPDNYTKMDMPRRP